MITFNDKKNRVQVFCPKKTLVYSTYFLLKTSQKYHKNLNKEIFIPKHLKNINKDIFKPKSPYNQFKRQEKKLKHNLWILMYFLFCMFKWKKSFLFSSWPITHSNTKIYQRTHWWIRIWKKKEPRVYVSSMMRDSYQGKDARIRSFIHYALLMMKKQWRRW